MIRRVPVCLLAVALSAWHCSAPQQPTADEPVPEETPPREAPAALFALVGATVIDGTGSEPIEDGVVVVDAGRIAAVGRRAEVEVPVGATRLDMTGRFVTPGLVDPHVHFFQSGGLYARPDIADLRSVRPYEQEVELVDRSLPDTWRRWLASGVTAVVDMGGPFWNFEVRERARSSPLAPRVAVAGPLVSTIPRPQLDVGDPPIIEVTSVDDARALVRRQLEREPDLIKIWFILPQSGDVTENLALVRAAIDEAHGGGVRVAVHATELETARAAVLAGADILVHSVDDQDVDQPFVDLLVERGTIYITTLVVHEGYAEVLGGEPSLSAVERALGSPDVISSWSEIGHSAAGAEVTAQAEARRERLLRRRPIMARNLLTLHRAGVTIAAGTDAGNIGTLHGPALHRELELLAEAGLSPEAILVAVTRDAARVFAPEPDFGTIEPGRRADLLVVDGDPLTDIRNLTRIHRVVLGGRVLDPSELVPASPEAVVQGQLDAYNARDLDRFVGFYAPEVVIRHHPSGEELMRGREAMRQAYGPLFEGSPELRCTLVERLVQGRWVVDHEFLTGLRDRPPFHGIAMYEVEGGLIQRVWFPER